jgi:hypothetical protein
MSLVRLDGNVYRSGLCASGKTAIPMITWIGLAVIAIAVLAVIALFFLEQDIAAALAGLVIAALVVGVGATVAIRSVFGADGGLVDMIYQASQVSAVALIVLSAVSVAFWVRRRRRRARSTVKATRNSVAR